MAQILKLFNIVLSGKSDKNIKFSDLQRLLLALGFCLDRVKGDHFIYVNQNIKDIVNIQPDKRDSSKAKSIQVKQVREIIKKYDMEVQDA